MKDIKIGSWWTSPSEFGFNRLKVVEVDPINVQVIVYRVVPFLYLDGTEALDNIEEIRDKLMEPYSSIIEKDIFLSIFEPVDDKETEAILSLLFL